MILQNLGSILITPGAEEILSASEIQKSLIKHTHGDWGNVPEEDWEENNKAVELDFRVISSYRNIDGEVFWIITEADRSVTTILLPNEY